MVQSPDTKRHKNKERKRIVRATNKQEEAKDELSNAKKVARQSRDSERKAPEGEAEACETEKEGHGSS